MYEIYCKLRDEKGVKDADVARETGITKSTFTDWKNGRSVPGTDKLMKISEYLGVRIEYLKTGKEPEQKEYPERAWTEEHLELLELFDGLKKEQKSAILNLMRSFAL